MGTNNGHKCREISMLVNTDKEKRLLVAIGKGKSLLVAFESIGVVGIFNKIPIRIYVKTLARISR